MLATLLVVVAVGGMGAVDPYSGSSTGTSICPAGPVVEGLDASKYEGSVDWAKVAASGIGFAIARVSDGLNYPDATFDTNWAGIKAAGMVRGSYQYFEPAQDPVAQADMVLNHVGTLGPGDLPPVIDVETMGGVSASAVMAGVDKWLSTIETATGRRALVYVSPSFWDGLGDPTATADLWIANWGVSCPSVPAAWSGWKFWQYTATGAVSGVPVSQVDLDRFNGTTAELLAYTGAGAGPAATITAPAAGATVSGTVTVSASANAATARVELYVDAALLASAASASWNTASVADGAHQLTAKAYDASGGSTTSAAVSVTVSNSSGGGGCSGFFSIGATCPPPPGGCETSAAAGAGLLALLPLLRRRRRR